MDLENLKDKYNYLIERNKNAEKFFEENSVEECMKYLKLFNQITIDLSNTRNSLEKILNRKMTKNEILNGFRRC